jgi:hypothetical protein
MLINKSSEINSLCIWDIIAYGIRYDEPGTFPVYAMKVTDTDNV